MVDVVDMDRGFVVVGRNRELSYRIFREFKVQGWFESNEKIGNVEKSAFPFSKLSPYVSLNLKKWFIVLGLSDGRSFPRRRFWSF